MTEFKLKGNKISNIMHKKLVLRRTPKKKKNDNGERHACVKRHMTFCKFM